MAVGVLPLRCGEHLTTIQGSSAEQREIIASTDWVADLLLMMQSCQQN
jgi:hypothetical protein